MLPLRHTSAALASREKTVLDPTVFMTPPRRALDVLYRDYKYPDFRGGSLAQRPLFVIDGRLYPSPSRAS
ncbi:unnamed protein product [Auanema sp. JU1783]|nr:unnamed protein product [Auanema sp. JU1783]